MAIASRSLPEVSERMDDDCAPPVGGGTHRPVVIVGAGRVGSTLLNRMLELHPDLAWFSGYSNRWPDHPSLAVLNRLADVPVLPRYLSDRRGWPHSAEALALWAHVFPGFYQNDSDWGAEHATSAEVARFRSIVDRTCAWQGRPRFLTKYTGHLRLRFLRAVLPDVTPVYLSRDPRASAMSFIKLNWAYKNKPELRSTLSPRQRIDRAVEWYLEHWTAARAYTPGVDYVAIRYEDLVASPVAVVGQILSAAGLESTPKFWSRFDRLSVVTSGLDAWRADLAPEDEAYLTERLAEPLADYAR